MHEFFFALRYNFYFCNSKSMLFHWKCASSILKCENQYYLVSIPFPVYLDIWFKKQPVCLFFFFLLKLEKTKQKVISYLTLSLYLKMLDVSKKEKKKNQHFSVNTKVHCF